MVAIPSFFDLLDVLTDETVAVLFLERKGILCKSICSVCQHEATLRINRKMFRCKNSACRKEWSCLKGTFFAKSKLPIHRMLFLSYHWLAGATHDYLCAIGGFGEHTVTEFFVYLRELVADSLEEEDIVIGGEGIVVELDESKFGKRKYNRGHHVEGVWVFGGVERTPERKVFLTMVEKRDAHTLRSIILKHVHPGSILVTDFWRGYLGIEDLGYTHLSVNHSKTFVDEETGACTNYIEGTWSGVKRKIPVRNRTAGLEGNLWEFIWRRRHGSDLWNGFLDALIKVTYD
jgi:hypothetical protein